MEGSSTNQEKNDQMEGQNIISDPILKPIENLVSVPNDYQHNSEPCLIDSVTKNSLEQQQSDSTDEMPETIYLDLQNLTVGAEPVDEESKSDDEVSRSQPLENATDIEITIQCGNKTPQKTCIALNES